MRYKSNFIESNEGFSYIAKEDEEKITMPLLSFCEPAEKTGASRVINTIVKQIKLNELDRVDSEFIDIDELLKVYVGAFQAARKS